MRKNNSSLIVYDSKNAQKWNRDGGCDCTARPWVVQKVSELAKQKGINLLDVGSGTGRWTKQFASYAEKVIGIDISPEMVEIAKRTNSTSNLRYIQGDILTARLGRFDVITSLAMLQHTQTREELSAVYSKIYEILSSGGHFLFYVPHPLNVYFGKTSLSFCEHAPEVSYLDNFPFTAHIAMADGSTRTGSGFHHSIQEYLGELAKNGFIISRIEELVAEGDKLPSALVVDAQKPRGRK